MFKMPIESATDCEIRRAIRFLNAKGVKTADIHREICDVYEEDIMSHGVVRKWVFYCFMTLPGLTHRIKLVN